MSVQFKKVSLADRVFDKLEEDILLGKYPTGSTLTELRLAEELGVSRTPIHEALRQLEQERLIQDIGKGYRIVGITKQDVEDVMDIRLNVEGLAAYYAAQNRTEADLKRLREIVELQEFYTRSGDADRIKEMDDNFHTALLDICGHQVIADVLNPLHKKIQNYRRASISDQRRIHAIAPEHRAVYEAIAKGEAAQAQALMQQHARNGKESMMERELN